MFFFYTMLDASSIEPRRHVLCECISTGSTAFSICKLCRLIRAQVWFQDLAFRAGVYQCQANSDDQQKFEDSPVFQLQVTFAALQESRQVSFNPIKLMESLQLPMSEQQDAQE